MSLATLSLVRRRLGTMGDMVRLTLEGPDAEPGRTPALAPDDREFHRHHGVHELATEQGVTVIDDLDALADASATKEELDAFLDALGS